VSILAALRSRRTLAGGIALAAGTAAITAPVVAPPLSAEPVSGDADVSPANGASTGTYESCTAMFGLTNKTNANYVTFTVGGTTSPLPGIGSGLTPVLTVDDGGDIEECTPEIGFDDAASWFVYIGDFDPEVTPFITSGFPYPGSTGYLIPNFNVPVAGYSGPAAVAPQLSLRVVGTDPAPTVISSPTDIDVLPISQQEIVLAIVNELGGPTSELGARYTEYYEGAECVAENPVDIAMAAALIALTGVPEAEYDDLSTSTCDQVLLASTVRSGQVKVASLATEVFVTVDAPTPPPAPRPEAVTPSFTG